MSGDTSKASRERGRAIASVALALASTACSLNWSACSRAVEASANVPDAAAWHYADSAWREGLPRLLARIQPPQFPDRVYAAVSYGAKSDSTFDSRPGIQAAIDACHAAGGGRVVLPAGQVRSDGPLELRSGVNLVVPAATTLSFGWDSLDYRPLRLQRWEGTVLYNWSPLIYAREARDIAVTGGGTIHGNGRHWRHWRARQKAQRDRLRDMGRDGVPDEQRVFGDGFLDLDGDGRDDGFGEGRSYPFRPDLLQFYDCDNVLIDGPTFRESPFWSVHPVFCRNVTIRNVTVEGHFLNDDGIDPDSCTDVLVEDCTVDTVDDALAVKAGRDQDGWQRAPMRNLVVRRCSLRSTTNAWTIGSEMSGGVENVFVEDCVFTGATHPSGRGHGITFKSNLDRGGFVRDIFIRDCRVDSAEQAGVVVRMDYHGYRGGDYPPDVQRLYLDSVAIGTVSEGPAFRFVGVEQQPIRGVYFRDVTVDSSAAPSVFEHTVSAGLDSP